MQRLVFVALAAVLFTGCYTVAVEYTPTQALADASAPAVQIQIVDNRPEDENQHDGRVIGQYRGSFGIPAAVENGTSGVMQATVTAVTVDALAGAGVTVSPDAEHVLTASVQQYWADGMMGIGSWVRVEYSFAGMDWTAVVEGEGGGGGVFSNQVKAVEEAVEEALVDLAANALVVFQSEEFQAAVTQ